MPTFSVPNNFVSGTDAIADDVDANFADIVDDLNNADQGTATWANAKVSATVANPVDVVSSASTTEVSINNTATDGDPEISFKLSGVAKAVAGIDDSDSDKFKIAHASTLGTTSTDDFVMSTSTGAIAIRGTATNDSAATGFVGERVSSAVANVVAASTGTYGDLTSISLTAGDWDVSSYVGWDSNGATWAACRTGISVTAGNSSTGLTAGDTETNFTFASSSTTPLIIPHALPVVQMTLTATTTVYLKYRATFTVGTPNASGRLTARRVR